MSTFSKIWDTEVKPLAEACITEPEFIKLLSKNENYILTQEEEEYIKNICHKYKDVYGMYCISYMIRNVEHALADDRESNARFHIAYVYSVLSSPTYFQNIFGSNPNNDEWQTRKSLCDGLYKLMHDTNISA